VAASVVIRHDTFITHVPIWFLRCPPSKMSVLPSGIRRGHLLVLPPPATAAEDDAVPGAGRAAAAAVAVGVAVLAPNPGLSAS